MDIEAVVRLMTLSIAGGIGLLLWYLSRSITAYLAVRFSAQQLFIAKETALMVVSTLKQSPAYEHLDFAKKKEIAMVWMSQRLAVYGLNFTPQDIDRLIEEAVFIIKEPR
jgi:hypothetical protein